MLSVVLKDELLEDWLIKYYQVSCVIILGVWLNHYSRNQFLVVKITWLEPRRVLFVEFCDLLYLIWSWRRFSLEVIDVID